jgi:PqqD family protein of HPr-rel-A system
MSIAHRLGDLALSDTGFAFDPRTGATYTINTTGLLVLQAMKEGLSRDAIGERLKERFDARGADVVRDIEDFIALLEQHGIVGESH